LLTGEPEFSYHFEDIAGEHGGFRVWAQNRKTTQVWFDGRYWNAKADDDNWIQGRASLLAFVPLVRLVAEVLMQNWKRDETRTDFPFIHGWVRQQTAKAISRRVHVYWQRVVDKIPPDRLRLLKLVFSTTLRDHTLLWNDDLYKNAHLVRDLERYRAARHVLVELHDFGSADNFDNFDNNNVGAFEYWRDLLSDTDKSYPALNRTLDALPGNIKTSTVWQLQNKHLERAITDRLELLTAIVPSGWYHNGHTHVLMHARHDEIVRAMRMVTRYTHCNLSPRRQSSIEELVTFLNGYRPPHSGNIVGLAQKAIDWHKHEAEERINMQFKQLSDTTPTKEPPIPLPNDTHIQFLSTTGMVRSEGIAMNHCIASYAKDAQQGECFLFHVDYKGETASVQVMPDGRVAQAYGSFNSTNRASQYGRRALSQWGRKFPKKPQSEHQNYFADNPVRYAEFDLADVQNDVAF